MSEIERENRFTEDERKFIEEMSTGGLEETIEEKVEVTKERPDTLFSDLGVGDQFKLILRDGSLDSTIYTKIVPRKRFKIATTATFLAFDTKGNSETRSMPISKSAKVYRIHNTQYR